MSKRNVLTPLISIIVPTLNQGSYIEQTLASITGQCWPQIEIIVIDGGSTDQTHDVVGKFGSAITHFISEKDRGQAEAINKGMRLAKGDVLAWLNSDDMYLPCTFSRVLSSLGNVHEPHLTYGSCLTIHEKKSHAQTWFARPFDRQDLKVSATIYQPSSFWTRALWNKAGELNEDYHFVLDWDWFLRASAFADFQSIPDVLSIYRFHDGHKTGSKNPKRLQEICEFVEKNAGEEWGAAFRDVSSQIDSLTKTFDWLKRVRLYRFRTWIFRSLYRKHGAKVKIALSQLRV